MVTPSPVPARCVSVWLGACLALAVLVVWVLPDLGEARTALGAGDLARQPFERLLLWSFEVAALAGAGWLWLLTTMVSLEAARGTGSPVPGRPVPGVPPVVRRFVLAACGVALTGAVLAPAGATPGDLHLDQNGSPRLGAISGLPLPDRPTEAMSVPGGPVHRPASDLVEVRPGDTLWGIAATRLGPGASAETIQREWHRIYDANRGVVGPDPDLVHPGQQLRLPRS